MSRIDEELKRIRAKLNDRYDDEEEELENEIENGLDGDYDDYFDDDYDSDEDSDDVIASVDDNSARDSVGAGVGVAGSEGTAYGESDDADYDDADYEDEAYDESEDSGHSDTDGVNRGYGESEGNGYDDTDYDDDDYDETGDDYDETDDADYDDNYDQTGEAGYAAARGTAYNRKNNRQNDPRNELEKFAEEPEEYTDYYGIEQVKKRPAKKIIPKEQEKTRSLRMKRYKEQSLARYSNIYMIAGVFIGIAIFFFLVSPELKNNYDEKLREVENKYNKTLSTKNSEIDNLKQEVEGLTAKNEEYANTQAAMQTNIDNLSSEVEMLKQAVENNGMMLGTMTDAYVATNTDALPKGVAVPNAAAERNNANVIGISRTAIEEMIQNE